MLQSWCHNSSGSRNTHYHDQLNKICQIQHKVISFQQSIKLWVQSYVSRIHKTLITAMWWTMILPKFDVKFNSMIQSILLWLMFPKSLLTVLRYYQDYKSMQKFYFHGIYFQIAMIITPLSSAASNYITQQHFPPVPICHLIKHNHVNSKSPHIIKHHRTLQIYHLPYKLSHGQCSHCSSQNNSHPRNLT